jgi:hypothetical protein
VPPLALEYLLCAVKGIRSACNPSFSRLDGLAGQKKSELLFRCFFSRKGVLGLRQPFLFIK